MTTVGSPSSRRYRVPQMPVRRFTVAEYHRLIDEGFFAADEQFELIDGLITEKMSRNPPHDATVNKARRRIERALPDGWFVRVQSAVTLPDSEPEPDIAIARGDDEEYVSRHPGPADLALVIEVANTTLATDRGPKLAMYERASIRAYWIINLNDRQIEIYGSTDAGGSAYGQPAILKSGESVSIALDGGLTSTIPVDDLLI